MLHRNKRHEDRECEGIQWIKSTERKKKQSHRWHGRLSLLSVVASEMGRSLVQGNLAECESVVVCDLRTWPGPCWSVAIEKEKKAKVSPKLWSFVTFTSCRYIKDLN